MAGGDESRGRNRTEGSGADQSAPFSFVVVLKPASGNVLISGGPIGTHEIPIASAQSLYDGLHEAIVELPTLARKMAG